MLVGVTGSGKSTTGNCLYHKSGILKNITDSPFLTSDTATGCTKTFELAAKDNVTILDTIGFGDPQFDHDPEIHLKDMIKALERVNNMIDCVFFVVRKGRFSNDIVKFFGEIQEKVLKNKCVNNSILLITDCNKKGWVEQQGSNEYLQKALENCNRLYYEFYLKFDGDDDDEDDRNKNLEKRQNAINDLVKYVNSKSFEKICLKYVEETLEEEKRKKEEKQREEERLLNEELMRKKAEAEYLHKLEKETKEQAQKIKKQEELFELREEMEKERIRRLEELTAKIESEKYKYGVSMFEMRATNGEDVKKSSSKF